MVADAWLSLELGKSWESAIPPVGSIREEDDVDEVVCEWGLREEDDNFVDRLLVSDFIRCCSCLKERYEEIFS